MNTVIQKHIDSALDMAIEHMQTFGEHSMSRSIALAFLAERARQRWRDIPAGARTTIPEMLETYDILRSLIRIGAPDSLISPMFERWKVQFSDCTGRAES